MKNAKNVPLVLEKTFGTSAIFTPSTQNECRTVTFGDCQWSQGITPKGIDAPLIRSLSVRHARVIFGMFKFFQDNFLDRQTKINVGFSGLTRLLNLGDGGMSKQELRRLFGDLASIWMRCVYPDGTVQEFKVLDYTTTSNSKGETKLDSVCFSAGFISMIRHVGDIGFFSLFYDTWCGLTSGIAQAIYLQMTSKVMQGKDQFTSDEPWRKNISDILSELGMVVPAYKSERKRLFDRARGKGGSVIDQLNGVEIQQEGLLLRARLEENAGGDDFNLCLWTEKAKSGDVPKKDVTPGALEQCWLMSGRTPEEFDERMRLPRTVNGKVLQDLERIGFPVKDFKRYLDIANKLLAAGELEEIVAECKMRVLDRSVQNSVAYLCTMVKNAIVNQSLNEPVLPL